MPAPIRLPSAPGNVHLDGLRGVFGNLSAGVDAVPAFDKIVLLCFTNRCGSNYLAQALASTGRINPAEELLNVGEIASRRRGEKTFAEYLHGALSQARIDGRVALKTAWPHLEILWEAGLLDHWRDRIVYVMMERLDRLAQAISADLAAQTEKWHFGYPGNGVDPAFRRDRIIDEMGRLADANRWFDMFFGVNGLVPEHVTYEAADAAPAETVARLGRAIGLPDARLDPSRIWLRRQADARNAAWRARFLAGDEARLLIPPRGPKVVATGGMNHGFRHHREPAGRLGRR